MSQSLLYHAFGVREGYEYQRTSYVEGRVEFHLKAKDETLVCPHCGQRESVIRQGCRTRRIKAVPIGLKPVVLVAEVPKCRCKACEKAFEVSPFLSARMPTRHDR